MRETRFWGFKLNAGRCRELRWQMTSLGDLGNLHLVWREKCQIVGWRQESGERRARRVWEE